jgi:hypothetical protein
MDSRAYTGDFNYIEFIANSKSGQFFFYSHDGCYMIKTQTKEECVLLRDIMPKYVAHLTSNPNSLLVRFYGMHRYGALGNFCAYFAVIAQRTLVCNLAPETSADFLAIYTFKPQFCCNACRALQSEVQDEQDLLRDHVLCLQHRQAHRHQVRRCHLSVP